MTRIRVVFAGIACAAVLAGPLAAVGLAPLRKEGVTTGPVKAFYLTVINPYSDARDFTAYKDPRPASTLELPGDDSVTILPSLVHIGAGKTRNILVLVRKLAPGETRETRICAELAKQEGMIHARVCSTLVARRLAPRG